MASAVEDLLRDLPSKHTCVQLFAWHGRWVAIVHYDGGMTKTDWAADHGDPVDALRAGLIEDRRKADDLQRRYAAAVNTSTSISVAPGALIRSDDAADPLTDILG